MKIDVSHLFSNEFLMLGYSDPYAKIIIESFEKGEIPFETIENVVMWNKKLLEMCVELKKIQRNEIILKGENIEDIFKMFIKNETN